MDSPPRRVFAKDRLLGYQESYAKARDRCGLLAGHGRDLVSILSVRWLMDTKRTTYPLPFEL
jgi:hypothetical protein